MIWPWSGKTGWRNTRKPGFCRQRFVAWKPGFLGLPSETGFSKPRNPVSERFYLYVTS
jgi:hypothetical protein